MDSTSIEGHELSSVQDASKLAWRQKMKQCSGMFRYVPVCSSMFQYVLVCHFAGYFLRPKCCRGFAPIFLQLDQHEERIGKPSANCDILSIFANLTCKIPHEIRIPNDDLLMAFTSIASTNRSSNPISHLCCYVIMLPGMEHPEAREITAHRLLHEL